MSRTKAAPPKCLENFTLDFGENVSRRAYLQWGAPRRSKKRLLIPLDSVLQKGRVSAEIEARPRIYPQST